MFGQEGFKMEVLKKVIEQNYKFSFKINNKTYDHIHYYMKNKISSDAISFFNFSIIL